MRRRRARWIARPAPRALALGTVRPPIVHDGRRAAATHGPALPTLPFGLPTLPFGLPTLPFGLPTLPFPIRAPAAPATRRLRRKGGAEGRCETASPAPRR